MRAAAAAGLLFFLVGMLVVVFVFIGIPMAFIAWMNWKRRHE